MDYGMRLQNALRIDPCRFAYLAEYLDRRFTESYLFKVFFRLFILSDCAGCLV